MMHGEPSLSDVAKVLDRNGIKYNIYTILSDLDRLLKEYKRLKRASR